jgi:hypothetical protein
LSATLIQISGTNTPSRSKHTITGFCIQVSPLKSCAMPM